jgi:hypothetical protein
MTGGDLSLGSWGAHVAVLDVIRLHNLDARTNRGPTFGEPAPPAAPSTAPVLVALPASP